MDSEKLKQVLSEHKKWLDTEGEKGERADLRKANLAVDDPIEALFNYTDLRGADLRRADLVYADLGGVYLNNADLWQADFIRANLRQANLSCAKLIDADLSEANLREADLSGANLTDSNLNEADFSEADLSGAYLNDAYLIGTNLNGANLSGADFSKARLGRTCLVNIDLKEVRGLEAVYHTSPSILCLDSLMKSKAKIPEAFLRGCGLQDWEIEMTKLYRHGISSAQFTEQTYKMFERYFKEGGIVYYSVFISYAHEDKDFARKLHDSLQDSGIRCWLDEKQMLPGHDMHKEIDRGIRGWDKILLCCSEHSLKSWWVDKELATAFDRERELWKERGEETMKIIPLNLDGYILRKGWNHKHKAKLLERVAGDFTDWRNERTFEESLILLKKALMPNDAGREPLPIPIL